MSTAKKRPGFMVYFEDIAALHKLDDAQLGRLIRAMCHYAEKGEEQNFDDPWVEMAFSMFRYKLDRDGARYEEIRQKKSDAAGKSHGQTGAADAASAAGAANCNGTCIGNRSSSGNGSPIASPDPRVVALEKLKKRMEDETP